MLSRPFPQKDLYFALLPQEGVNVSRNLLKGRNFHKNFLSISKSKIAENDHVCQKANYWQVNFKTFYIHRKVCTVYSSYLIGSWTDSNFSTVPKMNISLRPGNSDPVKSASTCPQCPGPKSYIEVRLNYVIRFLYPRSRIHYKGQTLLVLVKLFCTRMMQVFMSYHASYINSILAARPENYSTAETLLL